LPSGDDRRRYGGYELVGSQIILKIVRNPDNDIVFFVSSNHADLTISQNAITGRDLGSVNNTYVNVNALKHAEYDIIFRPYKIVIAL